MMRRLRDQRDGTTAVEFALVAPILLAIVLGTMALGLGFWTKNALQETASETARCLAIGGSACAVAAAGCDSSVAGICYFAQIASQRGVPGIRADHVAIDRTTTYGEVSFTTVTVTYPVELFGYSYSITATGHFPNAA